MTDRYFAPGRVNLIGDHTDYSGGLVLPAAIDRGITLEIEPAETIELTSTEENDAVTIPADGSVSPTEGWGRYVAAVAAELDALGRPAAGFRGHLTSDLPSGAGLSSSAALEVVIAVALCDIGGFSIDDLALAGACQRAEYRAVGVPSGIMDQAISLLGRSGHAVMLDCATLEHRLIPLPPDMELLIIDSGVK